MIKQVALSVCLLSLPLVSFASHLEPVPDLPAGDAQAGKEKSTACAACHGGDGNSSNPMYPSLAGQVPGYIAGELSMFKSGQRKNEIMSGIASGLSKQDLADLDAYYVSQELTPGAVSQDELAFAKRGERLYRGGYAPLQVAACISCHGPRGLGVPRRYPRVAGQQRQYLETQLLAFKGSYQTPESGLRKSYGDIMTRIAFLLSDLQIREVSAYMHALQ